MAVIRNDGALGVDVQLQETASTVYDFNASTEEQEFTADNTTLRSPFDILAPSVTTSDELRVINEEAIDVLLVDIATSDNLAVQFEVQAKKTTDSTYTSLGISSSTRLRQSMWKLTQLMYAPEAYQVWAISLHSQTSRNRLRHRWTCQQM